MKNILALLCLLTSVIPVLAQLSKGTATIGGGVALSYDKQTYTDDPTLGLGNDEYKETSVAISPGYGYFIATNFCLGVNLNASLSNTTFNYVWTPSSHTKNRSLGIGPFARYYIPLDEKLYIYAAAGCTPSWTWTKWSGYGVEKTSSNSNSFAWNAGVGLSYFINPNTAAEAGFDYGHINGYYTSSLALNIGFRIFLRKVE